MKGLSDQQQRAVRDVAAGRINRYGLPGQWRVYVEGGQVVFEDQANGWVARVMMPTRAAQLH